MQLTCLHGFCTGGSQRIIDLPDRSRRYVTTLPEIRACYEWFDNLIQDACRGVSGSSGVSSLQNLASTLCLTSEVDLRVEAQYKRVGISASGMDVVLRHGLEQDSAGKVDQGIDFYCMFRRARS